VREAHSCVLLDSGNVKGIRPEPLESKAFLGT